MREMLLSAGGSVNNAVTVRLEPFLVFSMVIFSMLSSYPAVGFSPRVTTT